MKHTIRIVLILVFGFVLMTPVFAGNIEDSLYDQVSRTVMHKLAMRQKENDSLRQKGLPGNYIVYITDNDVDQDNTFPPNVLSLLQKNTKQSDVEKMWDFTGNTYLKRLPQKLQDFSKNEGYDYYVVVCAIYNYFRLDENTDFSDITWTKSDLLVTKKGVENTKSVNKDAASGKGGYRNLFRHLVQKFDKDETLQKSGNKSHVYHFVISTYLPLSYATDSRPVGTLRHFQGLYWTDPNKDTAFNKVWTTFTTNHQAELAGANNQKQTAASKEAWLEGFVVSNQEMLAGIRKAKPEELANIKNKAELLKRLKEIPEDVYAGFSASLRIQMLQILSADEDMYDDAQAKSCALIEQAPVSQADDVMKAMKATNPFVPEIKIYKPMGPGATPPPPGPNPERSWCLLKLLTEKTTDAVMGMIGDNNYQRLIKSITVLCYKSDGFREKAKALNDAYLDAEDNKLPDRVIFYTYNSFWSKVVSTMAYGKYIILPKIDVSTSYNGCELQTEKQLFLAYFVPNTTIQKIPLDPLEPIVFENNTDLGLLTDMNESPSQDHIVPAILLKYADDKGTVETITDATMAAIDAASMVTGYGEIKAGVTGIRKAWVIFDMVNSGINIVGNMAAYNSPKLKAVLNYYNLATGAIALTRMAGGAIKGVKGIYNALKAEKTAMNATVIRDFVKSIKEAGDDLAELLPDDAQRIKAYLQRLKDEAKARGLKNFEQSVDDAIATVNAGGKVISDALAKNKIFKQLTNMQDVVLESGLSLIHKKTKALIAHWTKGGKTLYIDAVENVGDDGKLIDIIEGETFVPHGGTAEVTDDLMIMQGADNTVYCVRGACFTAGTPVHTRGGIKPIEQVTEQEEVQSWDEKAGQSAWEKVVKTFRRSASRLVRLVAGRDTLWSTPEHPYYTESGWKMASEIKPGLKLRLASGLFAAALSTTSVDTAVTVYNFEVARTHNYCIGSQGIIVHNSCAILKKLTKKIKPELVDDFIKDFKGDANMLSKFDNGDISTKAWEALHSRPQLRKMPDLLENVTGTLNSRSMQRLGVNEDVISQIAKALDNDYKLAGNVSRLKIKALDDEMFSTLNKFGKFLDNNPQTELANFEKIISDLTNSGFPNRKGGHWIIKDIANDPKTFGGKKISFNVTQNVDDANYYADVVVEAGTGTTKKYKFVEYKAGEHTIKKQEEFVREFIKRDLRNEQVSELSQLEWRRDVPDANLKDRILGYLKSDEGREALNSKKIIDMFETFRGTTKYTTRINNVDKLLKFMEDNDDWFKLIFK